MKRIAINGFGRIGRAFFRLAQAERNLEVVAINDLMNTETAAYLLTYDSAHGTFEKKVTWSEDSLKVGGKSVHWSSLQEPSMLPWRALDVEVVIEATGAFTSYAKSYQHILAGAAHVIISAPVKDEPLEGVEAATVLMGVNTKKASTCSLTSNASCTTNAVGIPLALLEERVGIESALLNTIHGYTASQQVVDGPSDKVTNLRFGRAAAVNIIPSTTGAASATAKALPALEGSFDGVALRVPVISGSIADLTFVTKRPTSVKEINEVLEECTSPLFSVTREPIVSSDVIGMPYVSIADLSMTRVVNGTLVKLLLWYDNEQGYAHSLIEHALVVRP